MPKPTHMLTLAIAATLALSALSPASAATRHKRAAPVASAEAAQVEPIYAQPRTLPDWSPVVTPAWQAPNACISDEGYGRYSSCDSGDSN